MATSRPHAALPLTIPSFGRKRVEGGSTLLTGPSCRPAANQQIPTNHLPLPCERVNRSRARSPARHGQCMGSPVRLIPTAARAAPAPVGIARRHPWLAVVILLAAAFPLVCLLARISSHTSHPLCSTASADASPCQRCIPSPPQCARGPPENTCLRFSCFPPSACSSSGTRVFLRGIPLPLSHAYKGCALDMAEVRD